MIAKGKLINLGTIAGQPDVILASSSAPGIDGILHSRSVIQKAIGIANEKVPASLPRLFPGRDLFLHPLQILFRGKATGMHKIRVQKGSGY
jgi:hypothetical protein